MTDIPLPAQGSNSWMVWAAEQEEASDALRAGGGGGLAAFAVVDAGTNLSAARPSGAVAVYWRFNAGVAVGTNGVNVVNRQAGDLIYVAGGALVVAGAPLLTFTGNYSAYTKDPYFARTSMWGVNDPARTQLVASSYLTVNPDTFPVGTIIGWDVTPDPNYPGVQGYLSVDYGNYDFSGGQITPRQVYTITDMDVDVDWTHAGNTANSGLLSETWLASAAAPTGAADWTHEVAFFPSPNAGLISWVDTLPLLGSYTDRYGFAWNVRESSSFTGEPYLISVRTGYAEHKGKLPYADFFAFLIGQGKITGSEWFNGVAGLGVEPVSGVGTLTISKYAANYAGAARVPWTVTNLVASPASSSSVSLTWRPAAGATSHQYRVNGGTWTTAGSGTQTVTGLTALTAYTFEVRGLNTTGNGAASNTANATTMAAGVSNVVANGTFTDDTVWYGAGFSGKTISGGKANFTASPTYDDFSQTVTLTAGKYYELTWTISNYASGEVQPFLNGGTQRLGTSHTANGTFKERLLVNTGNTDFGFWLTTSGTLSVDDVSLIGPYNTATVGGS